MIKISYKLLLGDFDGFDEEMEVKEEIITVNNASENNTLINAALTNSTIKTISDVEVSTA